MLRTLILGSPRLSARAFHLAGPRVGLAVVFAALLACLVLAGPAAAAGSSTLSVTKPGSTNGLVTSLPAGIDCGLTCTADFADDATVTLTATPGPAWSFTGWGGACSGTATTCSVSMSAARSVLANFKPTPTTLTVLKAGAGSGTVTSSPAGLDCGATCTRVFEVYVTATITAVAAPGSTFTGWSGACLGSAATCELTMGTSRTVVAAFQLLPPQLTVERTGTGTGTVTSSPAGIACGGTCQARFTKNSTVTLTETAAPGTAFSGWSGACTGAAMTCTVRMDAAKSVAASFTQQPEQLDVATAGSGAGTVSSSPVGILCGAICQASYAEGATVTLIAAAAANSRFGGWSGACTGDSATCVLTMDEAKNLVATFVRLPDRLSLTLSGTGAGTVTGSPGGIACAATCQADIEHGTGVTLTAAPADGSTFAGWTGACTGAGATCTVTMDAATSVTATFTLYPVWLTVAVDGGEGMIVSDPLIVLCGGSFLSCLGPAVAGSSVTLQAVPTQHSIFSGWSGACTGSAAICVVSMSEAKSATAHFTPLRRVSVSTGGVGHGTVTGIPGGIDCTWMCQADVLDDTQLTLTAVAAPGSVFAGWGGHCAGSSPTCTLTIDAARQVLATFDYAPQRFTVVKAGAGSGSVTSSLGGIACGTTCEGDLPSGKTVTLTAVATPGSLFTGWSGACNGTAPTCTVWLWDEPDSVTATFAAVPSQPAEPPATDPGPDPAPRPDPAPPTSTATPPGSGLAAAPSDTALVTPVPVPVAPSPTVPAPRSKTRPALRVRPKVTGRARVGTILTCSHGSWSGSPAGYSFTWRRDGKVIGHGARHLVRAADRGHSIRCDVAAGNAAGTTYATSGSRRVPR